jgi:hypothetical protein
MKAGIARHAKLEAEVLLNSRSLFLVIA